MEVFSDGKSVEVIYNKTWIEMTIPNRKDIINRGKLHTVSAPKSTDKSKPSSSNFPAFKYSPSSPSLPPLIRISASKLKANSLKRISSHMQGIQEQTICWGPDHATSPALENDEKTFAIFVKNKKVRIFGSLIHERKWLFLLKLLSDARVKQHSSEKVRWNQRSHRVYKTYYQLANKEHRNLVLVSVAGIVEPWIQDQPRLLQLNFYTLRQVLKQPLLKSTPINTKIEEFY